ncbi:nucleoside monophosphate kinase [Verrucomicrobiota bacterium]
MAAGPTCERRFAALLAGPTGSGKTPLGDLLQTRGLKGRRCFHFDFGAELRRIAEEPARHGGPADEDVEVVRGSLRSGALLEDRHFHIAETILRAFLDRNGLTAPDLVVLNGLPRHVGQAAAIDESVSVELVVWLRCGPEVVHERILRNSGGDRTGRTDDTRAEVAAKLRVFEERTRPLLDYYRAGNVRVVDIDVGVGSGVEDMLASLEQAL